MSINKKEVEKCDSCGKYLTKEIIYDTKWVEEFIIESERNKNEFNSFKCVNEGYRELLKHYKVIIESLMRLLKES